MENVQATSLIISLLGFKWAVVFVTLLAVVGTTAFMKAFSVVRKEQQAFEAEEKRLDVLFEPSPQVYVGAEGVLSPSFCSKMDEEIEKNKALCRKTIPRQFNDLTDYCDGCCSPCQDD